ncbi:MAG: hypothetical protein M0037_14670 [Betaproteobacteria bacterium]|nr:hypothetical protein [Betaproteobacteria bacterium]
MRCLGVTSTPTFIVPGRGGRARHGGFASPEQFVGYTLATRHNESFADFAYGHDGQGDGQIEVDAR